MGTVQAPFSNLQMELLQLYKTDVQEEDLVAVKSLIATYFAQKAIALADDIWDSEGWGESSVKKLLTTKMRTAYNKHTL
jgi:hypothetical protein